MAFPNHLPIESVTGNGEVPHHRKGVQVTVLGYYENGDFTSPLLLSVDGTLFLTTLMDAPLEWMLYRT